MCGLLRWLAIAAGLAYSLSATALAEDTVWLATTTTVEDSGLLEHLLEHYAETSGDTVRVLVRGTGEVLALAQRGDVDLILVHDTEAERNFVAAGHGVARAELMYNDFVIVGPADDPAGVSGMTDASGALARIAEGTALFISRGDDSGTHRRERNLWQAAGRVPDATADRWYLESGSGQGATLNIAIARGAYALTDRATWLGFANRGDHRVLVDGDPRLRNVYGLVPINPAHHGAVNAEGAGRLGEWLLSPAGQDAIAAYWIDGMPAFTPSASDWEK